MKVLALSFSIPFPPVGGGEIRTHRLLRALAERHDVTLVGFTYGQEPAQPAFPIRIVTVPWEWPSAYREMYEGDGIVAQAAFDRLGGPSGQPWFASVLQSAAMERTLDRLAALAFDVVLIEHADMARFLDRLPQAVPKVLDFHDVYSRMAERALAAAGNDRRSELASEFERTVRFERQSASACALCLACSETDAAAVRNLLLCDRVDVVPNGVDTTFFAPSGERPSRGSLLFTGTMNYGPNVDAVAYFVHEIWPLLRNRISGLTFEVVGANPTDEVGNLASDDVIIHGGVADMRPYYRRAAVVVVPLRQGGGTRLKILEAAASGKAVVSSSLGVEGLNFGAGKDLLVSDSPSGFAHAITFLLDNESSRAALEQAARRVALQYEWEAICSRFCHVMDATARMSSSAIC
jgi:glycosyltransferase involved in cell wall biosynthesis